MSVQKLRNYFDVADVNDSSESRYTGERGAMVLDVITSRQRKYETRVVGIVQEWSYTVPERTLAALSANLLPQKQFGLRDGETESIQDAANALLRFGRDQGLSDEDGICLTWANAVEDFRFTPKLDPYLGSVSGIGIALFAYARKLSGADAIKPDVRVRQRLQNLGIQVPEGSQALMKFCELLAEELAVTRSRFDTVLWAEPKSL